MTHIGGFALRCNMVYFTEEEALSQINVYYSMKGVLALGLTMSNGENLMFGKQELTDEDLYEHKMYEVHEGAQLLGMYGNVLAMEDLTKPLQLMSLGFFQDKCSATTRDYATDAENLKQLAREEEIVEGVEERRS